MVEMKSLRIQLPGNIVDFAFGDSESMDTDDSRENENENTTLLGIGHYFSIMVQGLDIWAQAMTFILKNGRRAPGMCSPGNCPWIASSPWGLAHGALENWRMAQERKLHYPENEVAIHVAIGYGEPFAYINLIYYLRYGSSQSLYYEMKIGTRTL